MIGDVPDDVDARGTIQSPHPSRPRDMRASLRNIENRMAEMTTESALNGFFEWRTKENEIYWGKIHNLS